MNGMNTFRMFHHLTADPPAALVYTRIADLHDAARAEQIDPIARRPRLLTRLVDAVLRSRPDHRPLLRHRATSV
ncbi:hypothetical protein CH254_13370 [Rhodococcus sp. 06-412-2C]|nr:hypothetical protein CH286_08065 [Rhodococcus sp. WWJCD1]OZC88830.1 hypothetical protein CH254_13370 [Rhodococcus sp. 06-412-2C]OZD03195.1 hypothetical protein CH279_02900 [Rhodococcus sp. 06-412-2B]